VAALSDDDTLPPVTPTRPERALTALAVAGMALLCVIVTTTVVVRALGLVLIPDDVLLVQELMVVVILLPLAAVTARREHIAVTVFTARVPPRGQRALALLGHAVGMLFAGALLWVGTRTLLKQIASGEYYDGELYLPTWIGWTVFTVGCALFLLRLLLLALRDARALLSATADG